MRLPSGSPKDSRFGSFLKNFFGGRGLKLLNIPQQTIRVARNLFSALALSFDFDGLGAKIFLAGYFMVIKRRFPTIVDLGSGAGHVAKFLEEGSTEKLIMCDESKLLLNRDEDVKYPVNTERVVYENEVLPFEENSIPAVISSMALHWTNDLPGILIQINRALKPDGLFLAALLGGDTLFELRTSIQLAEQERGGGLSPRVSPFAESRDATNLLTRAGFALTTVDVEDIVVEYPSMFHLIEDLEAMGDSNGILVRNPFIKRDTLIAAAAIYEAAHGNEDGTVPATFQVRYH
ncbi:hypothetical protein DSO57_1022992 [Entomophthora muscae]|uniref:Uncharacterized protein n=1 Tax=Entomophthora muscae TaxID=34485 RepID=A0ACC2T3H5_9FUNG|nr:hypothetical protein DSO57_1022992 [Entomophthora muscae]